MKNGRPCDRFDFGEAAIEIEREEGVDRFAARLWRRGTVLIKSGARSKRKSISILKDEWDRYREDAAEVFAEATGVTNP